MTTKAEGWPSQDELQRRVLEMWNSHAGDEGVPDDMWAWLAVGAIYRALAPAAPASGAEQTHDGEAPGPVPLTAALTARASASHRDGPSPICSECRGTGRHCYVITNHGERNEQRWEACKVCKGTGKSAGPPSPSPPGWEEARGALENAQRDLGSVLENWTQKVPSKSDKAVLLRTLGNMRATLRSLPAPSPSSAPERCGMRSWAFPHSVCTLPSGHEEPHSLVPESARASSATEQPDKEVMQNRTRPVRTETDITRPQSASESAGASSATDTAQRECTCHPDDNPPKPCPQKYAYSECAASAQREARLAQQLRQFVSIADTAKREKWRNLAGELAYREPWASLAEEARAALRDEPSSKEKP